MTTVTTLRPGDRGSGSTARVDGAPPARAPSVAEWQAGARLVLGYELDAIGTSFHRVGHRGEGWDPLLRHLLERTDDELEAEFAPWAEESLVIARQTFEASAEAWAEE